eukprot:365471-Chlamydomonas_euryale.AAC.24
MRPCFKCCRAARAKAHAPLCSWRMPHQHAAVHVQRAAVDVPSVEETTCVHTGLWMHACMHAVRVHVPSPTL